MKECFSLLLALVYISLVGTAPLSTPGSPNRGNSHPSVAAREGLAQ